MVGPQTLGGVSARLLRLSSSGQRAQWGSVRRQWQRPLSQTSTSTSTAAVRPRTRPHLRTQRRYDSTAADQTRKAAEEAASQAKAQAIKAGAATANSGARFVAYVYGTGLVLLLSFGYLYATDTRASIHQFVVTPLVRLVHSDAEEAHHAGVRYIKALHDFGLAPRERGNADKALRDLQVEVFGHLLDNPVGTSAGIDKDAEIPDALFALGAAVVEVGGATPLPQEGNPKPRVFRIPSQNALINRYGLNSQGAEHVAMQLRERVRQFAYDNGLGLEAESERRILDGEAGVPPGSLHDGKLLLVQVAKNKTTPDNDIAAVAADYVFCVEHLAKYADVLVVNVSSPNTPGLRDLQAVRPLTQILSSVVEAAKSVDRKTKPAVMVKVSPDEDSDAQIDGICTAVWSSGVDGVIVGNTTKKRPEPIPEGYIMPADDVKTLTEVGGYSGPQMFERTLNLVKRYRVKLDQGPPESSSNTQKVVQSPLDPLERGLTGDATPENAQQHATDESIERDQQRLKPLTAEAEAASKRPLIQLPVRHTSEDLQSDPYVGQAPERASTQPTDAAAPTNAVRSGQASSPREAAEGAVQKVISVGETGAAKAQSTASQLTSGVQSATSQAKAAAEDLASAAKSSLDSATSSSSSSARATASNISDKVSDLSDKASNLASQASSAVNSAASSAKESFNHITSDPYAEISAPQVTPPAASQPDKGKVIFATGGITNGEQCLQILNAGASVCQVYTAMMYGGVGTITRIKGEMRGEIYKEKSKRDER